MKNGDKVDSTFMQSVIVQGCSGTMLTNEWAIGCQHCYPTSYDNRSEEMFVYYDGEKRIVNGETLLDLFKQRQRVVEFVRHPSNTAGGNPYYRNIQGFDIALFRLETR